MDKGSKMLKVVLIIFAVVVLVYGLCYIIIPGGLVKISGAPPIDVAWIRWSGGILIGLGIGAIMAFRKPAKQNILVTTLALGSLLTGLGLLYSLITHEYTGALWFTVLATSISLVLSGLLWWSRGLAKDLLKTG